MIWCGVDYILEYPIDEKWDHSGLGYVYANKNYYDVIFAGTSTTITNISNEKLYLDYGIAAVTVGEPSQATYLSYYSLEEALKYQAPKVVVFDVKSLFYTEDDLKRSVEEEGERHHIHFSLDNMKVGLTKWRAFCQAKKIFTNLDFWDYFSKMYYNHVNWQDLGRKNFNRESSDEVMNGNLMLLSARENADQDSFLLNSENNGEIQEIPEINREYLVKIIDLCRNKQTPLLLIRGGGYFTWEAYNAIKEISEKYSVPYLDLIDCEEKYEIKLGTDSSDGNHFNVCGAEKWTMALGDYLSENYEFADRRQDASYNAYREKEKLYKETLVAMNNILLLDEATNFDSYLEALCKVDYSDTTVFVAVKDEASTKLTYNEIWQLNELGLWAELKNKFRYSYIGIFGEVGVHELLGEEQLYDTGKIGDDISYAVTSGGWDAGNLASITINGIEMAQNGRGINIVVYNSALDKVISSVYFDTHQYENPPTSRISTVSQEQYEAKTNSWLPLENYLSGENQ